MQPSPLPTRCEWPTDRCVWWVVCRRDAFMALAEKHLKGLAQWTTPTAGMFVWFKLLNGITDSQALINKKVPRLSAFFHFLCTGRSALLCTLTQALEKKVLLVPGQAFSPNNELSSYVRASFSTASEVGTCSPFALDPAFCSVLSLALVCTGRYGCGAEPFGRGCP